MVLSKEKTDFRIISMNIENYSEYRYNSHNVTCFKNYVSTLYLNVPAEIKFGQILSLQRDFARVAGPKTPLVCHWKNIVNSPFELPGLTQAQMMSEDILGYFFLFSFHLWMMVFRRQNLKCLTVENLRPSFEKLCLLDQGTLKSVKVPILCCSLINYTLVYQIFAKI